MLSALERGLTLSDFDLLTVGAVFDFVAAYNERHSDKEDENKERLATQADFDKF